VSRHRGVPKSRAFKGGVGARGGRAILKINPNIRGAVRAHLHAIGGIMNRRTTLMLAATTLFGLAILPQSGLAQTNAVRASGVFQLNIAKSKLPGAPLKSQTVYFEGQKATVVGIDAQGIPRTLVFTDITEDGKPHSVTGFPGFDASTFTRVDAYTVNYTRTKDGKVVQTGTAVVSPDGKTFTSTFTNTANGQQAVQVYEKQ
jgi:hypothetical protein